MKWFYVLTMEFPDNRTGAVVKCTDHGVVDISDDATRYDIYKWVRSQLPEPIRSGNTIFYTAEPDEVRT